MSTSSVRKVSDPNELKGVEQAGLIEDEKTFYSKKLGGNFVFRLPFVMDELTVLRKRAIIMGISEDLAGPELMAISHARAMFEVYNVHSPHKFDLEKLRSWQPLMELMMEVREWHDMFRPDVGQEEEQDSETKSEEPDSVVPLAV